MNDTTPQNRNVKLELIAAPGSEGGEEAPLQMLQRALRGRLKLVAIFAIGLGAVCAAAGYHAIPPRYESTGLVRVDNKGSSLQASSGPRMDGQTFSAFVASQATYLKSWPVLDAAVSDQSMRDLGWPAGPRGVAQLEQALSIERGKGEQLISVSVTSTDMNTARVAVDSILTAYQAFVSKTDDTSSRETEQILAEREAQLDADLERTQSEILTASNEYGYSAIVQMHEQRIHELIAIDEKIAELRDAQARFVAGGAVGLLSAALSADSAREDPRLEELRNAQIDLISRQSSLSRKLGPDHTLMRDIESQREMLRIEIELRENAVADRIADPTATSLDLDQLALLTPEGLALRQTQTEAVRSEVREDVIRLGRTRMALVDLQREEADIISHLTQTRSVLYQIRADSQRRQSNGIAIAAMGDLPVVPVSDRRAGFAVVGCVFGMMAGIGVFFLGTLIDPRLRYPDDLTAIADAPPVLGVIPVLDTADQAISHLVDQRVHQMRSLIESCADDDDTNVVCLTSADRREGKTSVALALATSFAAAGRKSLLIDLDLGSRGITGAMGLGDHSGVCESIGSSDHACWVYPTAQSDLFVMPAGSQTSLAPEGLCKQKVVRLLDAVRPRFDVIIIDTGPILESVEAFVSVSAADQVIVVASRNQRVRSLKRALQTIRRIGARNLAVVLNRAAVSERLVRGATHGQESTKISHLVSVDVSPLDRDTESLPFITSADDDVNDSQSTTAQTRKAA